VTDLSISAAKLIKNHAVFQMLDRGGAEIYIISNAA
jgi:hypothetical protein